MTKRLFQILTLAACVGFTAPATAQASSILITNTDPSAHFKFDTGANRYDFDIVFSNVVTQFNLTVTADDTPDLSNLPPGYVCVPIRGGNSCVMFNVSADLVGWTGSYDIRIAWLADTNGSYPNDPVVGGLGLIRILHFDSTGVSDITLPNSYCTTCGPDPAIGGRDDNFSDFLVVQQTAVPEPTSLVLLGSGFLLLGMRLRRRKA